MSDLEEALVRQRLGRGRVADGELVLEEHRIRGGGHQSQLVHGARAVAGSEDKKPATWAAHQGARAGGHGEDVHRHVRPLDVGRLGIAGGGGIRAIREHRVRQIRRLCK